jgi:release factor glutamine methyltransferase
LEGYRSSEDSALLRQATRDYRGRSCLEIGFGSGANVPTLCERFECVVGTDIIRSNIGSERQQGRKEKNGEAACADLLYADRATCFRDSSFDFVVFNPPYLPSDDLADRTVDGGRGGIEIPMMFMEEAIRVVRPSGTILFLLSNEADLEGFLGYCKRRGLRVKRVRERGVFFETLYVFEARRGRGRGLLLLPATGRTGHLSESETSKKTR